MVIKLNNKYLKGIKDGVPIALAYISVSFTFGLLAVEGGLSIFTSLLISLTNLTSAGQFAGLDIMIAGGTLIELAVTTLIINLRYFLMSFAISQKVDIKMNTVQRLICSFGITDEVFAVICQNEEKTTFKYFLGLITLPILGWSTGTLLGAGASMLLSYSVRSALSIAIYGMFIAIIIPPAKKFRPYFYAIGISVFISCVFKYTPFLNLLSGGWVIIIASVVASAICAYFFPIKR